MVKTLVTIGYHNGEVDWGREVRREYERRRIRGGRDIVFHEVTGSDVETGGRSDKVLEEIDGKIEAEGIRLWIDIHCKFDGKSKEEIVLTYSGIDEELLKRARKLDGVLTNNLNKIPLEKRPDGLKALADASFSREEFESKDEIYQKRLERTLRFINEIYDIHC